MPSPFPHAVDRPTKHTPAVRAKAIDSMLEDVMKHEAIGEDERDRTRKALDDAFEFRDDGYEAAKNLDSYHGWSPDADLVEVLDGFSSDLWKAHREAVAAWVKEYDIKPALKIGMRCKAKWGNEEITGVVKEIDDKHATYTVQRTDDENGGAIVDFEDAEEITQ